MIRTQQVPWNPGRFPAGMQDCWCGSKRWTVPRRGGVSPIMAFIGGSFSGRFPARKENTFCSCTPKMEGLHGDFSRSITFHVNFQGCINSNICFFLWILGSWICCVDFVFFFCWGLPSLLAPGKLFFPYNRRLNMVWKYWQDLVRMKAKDVKQDLCGIHTGVHHIYFSCEYLYQFYIISKQLYST